MTGRIARCDRAAPITVLPRLSPTRDPPREIHSCTGWVWTVSEEADAADPGTSGEKPGTDGEGPEDLHTLEPFLEAVREGVERRGWELSGLQKTTSYRFEGRWEGDSTRSAYLFFHRSDVPEDVSVDVYLDETSRGLKGNLALVMDVPDLGEMGPVEDALRVLCTTAEGIVSPDFRRPLTLRFRVGDVGEDPAGARGEARFKVHVPTAAVKTGRSAVVAVARSALDAFEGLLDSEEIRTIRGEAGSETGAPSRDD